MSTVLSVPNTEVKAQSPHRQSAASARKTAASSETVDRRVIKSRQALKQALIALIEENGVDSVTVGDLCQRAELNRGTFYNHFKDKDDLVATFEDEILTELYQLQDSMKKLSLPIISGYVLARQPLPFLVDLFDYLREQGEFLHAILGAKGDASFASRIKDVVCTNLVRSILHERYQRSDDPMVDYYVSFFASAYLGVIVRWIERGMEESSEEMARIAVRLLFIKPGESIKL